MSPSADVSEPVLVGADAGGSKLAIMCRRGSFSVEATGESFNVAKGDSTAFSSAFAAQVENILPDGVDARSIRCCLGAAGGGSAQFQSECRDFLMNRWGIEADHIMVVSDAVVALEAAFPRAAGIIVITGTGSGCYGRNSASSDVQRAGGWGPGLGDPASGTSIGAAAIRHVLIELENGERSPFGERILEKLGSPETTIDAVLDKVYRGGINVSELAPTVLELLEASDGGAAGIISDDCQRLASQCARLVRRLTMKDAPISLTGGLNENDVFARHLSRAIKREIPDAVLSRSRRSPVEGALDIAATL